MKKNIVCTILALFVAATPTLLTAQNNKAGDVVKAYYAAFDAGNTAEMEKLLSPDFMVTTPFLPSPTPFAAWKEIAGSIKAAFPDMQHPVKDWFSDGKKVAVSGMAIGTNKGSFMGNPPTGNKINFPFTAIFELASDLKIKSLNVQYDQKTMETQLMAGINPNAKTEETIRAYFKALDAGDLEKVASFCAPNCVQYFSGSPNPLPLDEVKKRATGFKTGFPDVKREIQEIVVASNSVTVRGLFTGTNTGMFMGKPATGKKVSIPHLALFHLNANGLIEKAYIEFDTKLVDKQLSSEAGGK